MAEDKLSDKEKEAFLEAFKKFDSEGTESIETDDLAGVLRAAGQAPSESELEEFKKELDPKDSGVIEYKELLGFYARIKKDSLEMNDELNDAFRIFDKSLNGYITSADLRKYMTTLGEKLTDEEVDEMIKDADPNGEGKIRYEEFTYTLLDQ